MNIIAYSTKKQTDVELADHILKSIKELAESKDELIIALSGGSTPVTCYKIIASQLNEIDAKINLIQVDERFVPPNHDRSNQKMIQEIFTENVSFIPMITPKSCKSLGEAITMTTDNYKQLFLDKEVSGPDLIVLGMGSDGHTASLFPNNSEYLRSMENDDIVIGMNVETQSEDRLSLTPRIINNSTHKILYAYGKDKLQTLKSAQKTNDAIKYPILSVINNISLYTVIDTELYSLSDTWKLQNFY